MALAGFFGGVDKNNMLAVGNLALTSGSVTALGSAASIKGAEVLGYMPDAWGVYIGLGGLILGVGGGLIKWLDHLDSKRHRAKIREMLAEGRVPVEEAD